MSIGKRILGHIYFFYGMLLFVLTMLIVLIPVGIALCCKEPLRAKIVYPTYRVWMEVFLRLVFCPVKRKGAEHFEKGQNYVVVVNHNSLVDIPVSMPWVAGPNKTLAKVEMASVPLFGWIYKAGSILVDRNSEASRKESFTKMQQALKLGLHLTLYPEGTRNKSEKPLQDFRDGAFVTAIRARKPIMPGIIMGTKNILPLQPKMWAWPQTIHFHFLGAISTDPYTLRQKDELKDKVWKLMHDYLVDQTLFTENK